MKPFPIVGVGASAGGLEAFTQLLASLPPDSGLGFVLVQHLDPKHESALTGLLAKTTSMPVRQAIDGTPVMPNHVYIIPPNTYIKVAKGVLRLGPRQESGARHEVDTFLQSLAADQGEFAIGVILSGTATDGTFGLEAIKAEGGITFAQDASAKYDGMPRSAIDAGCVDFILSPKSIAAELARISRHPKPSFGVDERTGEASKRVGARKGKSEKSFGQIIQLLREHTTVDFSLYKPATLQRRITRRMILLKLKSLESYSARLRADLKERDALYQDVLIGVTGFFRNPESFKALERRCFPPLFKARKPDDPIRVWVAGCSTGQEAYSLAMSLLEFMGHKIKVPLQIYGTDLNDALLEKARAGLYTKAAVQELSAERLRRFFVEEDGAYRAVKSLREICVFASHNVIADPPFSRMDILSCRNLLIYIEPEVQKKVISSFHYALKPGGALFLGASETIATLTDLFSPVDRKHKIYLKLPAPARPMTAPFPIFRKRAGKPAPTTRPALETRGFNVQREADRVALAEYSVPGVLINDGMEILQFRGETSPYLKPPRGNASFNLLKMARENLLLPLRSAVNKARKEYRRVNKAAVHIDQNGRSHKMNIKVLPLKNVKDRCFLVFFESAALRGAKAQAVAAAQAGSLEAPPRVEGRDATRLRAELAETRDYLQTVQEQYEAANEELQASSEEVQSSNEELQSINEELETSKEELESTNEELTTVNDEMSHRNAELTKVTADLNNLHMSVDMAIILLGRDLCIHRFNPPAKKLFNLMASDVGRPLSAVKSTLDFPDLETLALEVIAELSPQEREVRDFSGRWYSLRARPYLTLDNKVDGAVMTIVDITDLKRALQKAEAITDTVPPLLILDAELRVRKANSSFCDAFQVGMAETEGHLIYELGNGQWDIPLLRTLLQEILPREKSVTNFEVEHDFEKIGPRAVLLNGRVLDWGGVGRTILLSILDITDRKKAVKVIEAYNAELERKVVDRTQELATANKELETFCYSVAHDLRTPIRSIVSYSQLVLARISDAELNSYLQQSINASKRMAKLIDDLLELARLTRKEVKKEPIDLSAEADAIAVELKGQQPDRQVKFVIAKGLRAVGDAALVQIALRNLLDNAWKFTRHSSQAVIEVGRSIEEGRDVFFVRDNGVGFDMAYVNKLFGVFQRLHDEKEFPGTGIGLVTVQRIVQRHGGTIWAEGTPGGGATFSFTLGK
ncbi:MAG TPA: CheR family methyltransferase [Elusimicrobiota bacterium]|nr:CheR family methyltransferase [Elusimicrobiota bacterium]